MPVFIRTNLAFPVFIRTVLSLPVFLRTRISPLFSRRDSSLPVFIRTNSSLLVVQGSLSLFMKTDIKGMLAIMLVPSGRGTQFTHTIWPPK